MANRAGSRAAIRPKRTMEQAVAANLDPHLSDSRETVRYELATFRTARKDRSPNRNKGTKPHRPIAGG